MPKVGHDSYGKVLVSVVVDFMGYVVLKPLSPRRQREIAKSNLYNGSYDVYIQHDDDIEQFMYDFPRATWVNDHTGQREVNSGVRILIDSWTFRHMVGGQSD
jgi:hypothetical protein